MKCKSLYLLFTIGLVFSLQAQYYSTGQDPASIRWSQIKADSFRIIFPESFTQHSRSLAGILELTTRHETKTLRATVPRMPFLIHSSSAVSNGVTVWAPRRIELFSCPPQDPYAEEWLEQLALHEYRHAVQTSKMNRGFSKALYCLLGEQATGAILGLYIPAWFLEGDATVTETALSCSGRGRVASFSAPLRAQLLQKGIYTYDLATMGSYKTFTPDAYTLGYHLVAKGRDRYGFELWDYALDKAAKLPFMVVPFNAGIRQKTGWWKTRLYRNVLEELLVEWQTQEDTTWRSVFNLVTTPDPENFTTWDSPRFLNDSILIAAGWDNEGVPKLHLMDLQGQTKALMRLGAYQPGSLSVAGDAIVWTEYRPDIRWENRSYSVIRKLSMKTIIRAGSKPALAGIADMPDLTRKARYFSPALSPDGNRILAVRITEENDSYIDILEAGTGQAMETMPAPDGGLFLQPSWSSTGEQIAFILLTQEGKSLQVMHADGESMTSLLPPSFRQISGPPLFFRNFILFMADYTGIQNIFAIDTITRQLYQISSARFQAVNPSISPDGNTIVYSDYCADGMMVATRDADPSCWLPLDTIPLHTFRLAEEMAAQEGVNIQDSIRAKDEGRGTRDEGRSLIHRSPVTSHQSPVTSHQSPVTSHQSPVTSHQSPAFRHLNTPSPVTGSPPTSLTCTPGRRCRLMPTI